MFLRNGRAGRLVIDAGNCRAKPTLDQSRVPRADAAEPIGKLQRRLSGRLARQWHRFGANGPEQAAAAIPVAALASKRRTDVGSAYGSARVSGILDSPGRRDGTLRRGRTIDTDPAQALSPGVCDSGCSSEERGQDKQHAERPRDVGENGRPACRYGETFASKRVHETPIADAPFGCVRAARVLVETAHCRLVTRERMAVLCRGSND